MMSGKRLQAHGSRGFTLLELMVVVSIVALATAGVSFALRDNDATLLEREGLRLSALLESARAQSRTSGVAVLWRGSDQGFEFIGNAVREGSPLAGARSWLQPDTHPQITQPVGAETLTLGPEPLIAAQRLVIQQGERRLTLATDGLAPFKVVPEEPVP